LALSRGERRPFARTLQGADPRPGEEADVISVPCVLALMLLDGGPVVQVPPPASTAVVDRRQPPGDASSDARRATDSPAVVCVTIDARRGPDRSSYTFPTRSAVTVRIVNKNPFLFRYRLNVSATAVEEPAIAAFLAQLSPALAVAAKALGATGVIVIPSLLTEPAATCAAGDQARTRNQLQAIATRLEELMRDARAADRSVTALSDAHAPPREAYLTAKRGLADSWASAVELRARADTLVKTLEKYLADGKPQADVGDAADSLAALQADARALVAQIEDTRKTYAQCLPAGPNANALLDIRSRLLDLSGRVVAEHKARLDSMRADIAAFGDALRGTQLVLEDRNAFDQELQLPEHLQATNVAISLDRWPLDDKDDKAKQTVGTTTVMLGGGQRFYLSGGVGFVRGVATRDFQPVRGYPRDRSGTILDQAAMTTIVGVQQQSPRTVTPMALLNVRLAREMFATIGVTARDTGGVHLDYLVGGSWAALDRKVVFTLGWYCGREQSLAGDLYVGATIPESMTSIPVRTDYKSGLALVVSFKIK
jgi:hypothetical protein